MFTLHMSHWVGQKGFEATGRGPLYRLYFLTLYTRDYSKNPPILEKLDLRSQMFS